MNWKRSLVFIAIVVLLSLLFCQPIEARELHFNADKTTLQFDDSSMLVATYSGFISGEKIYIKGAFYKEGSTNYFGFTNNTGQWVKNSATNTSQREIIVDEWDGKLEVKADFSDTGFTGDGAYLLKIGYYYRNDTGTISAINWSTNTVSMQLIAPTPTPSTTPMPTVPQPTTAAPTTSPPPTANPTPSATTIPIKATTTVVPSMSQKIITTSPTKATQAVISPNDIENSVQATYTNINETSYSSEQDSSKKDNAFFPYAVALIFIGIGSALLSIVVVIIKRNEKT